MFSLRRSPFFGTALASLAVVLMTAFGSALPVKAGDTPVQWANPEDPLVARQNLSVSGDADGDGSADVVVASGDHFGEEYIAGTNPVFFARRAYDLAISGSARLVVRDGKDGSVQWQDQWRKSDVSSPDKKGQFVSDVEVGDFHSGRGNEILVLRSSYTFTERDTLIGKEHTTLYSGRTGDVLWNSTRRLNEGVFALPKFEGTSLPGGRRGGVLSGSGVGFGEEGFRVGVSVVQFTDGGFEERIFVPMPRDIDAAATVPMRTATGVRLLMSLYQQGSAVEDGGVLRAVEVDLT